MTIDSVVDVTVTKTSATVTQQGFGTPLGLHQVPASVQPNRFALYGSLQELLDAGFTVSDRAYLWAQTVLSAEEAPNQFAIGRRTPGVAQVDTFTVTTEDTGTWTVDLNGETFQYLAGGTDTPTTIAAGVAQQITESDQPVTAVAAAGVLTVTAAIPGTPFVFDNLVTPGGGVAALANVTANTDPEDVATALAAVEAENSTGWYGLNIDSRETAEIVAAAAFVGARKKIGAFQSSEGAFLAGTAGNVGETLAATNNRRVLLFYKSNDVDFADAGMLARALAADLDAANGVITWYGKQLASVPVDDLTTAQQQTILDNGGNVYVEIGGRGFVREGVSVEGEFMDVQTTLDWTEFRVQEAVFARIATTPTKIPFTNAGIATLSNEVLGVLNTGIANGHFTADTPPTVTAPNNNQVPAADKNSRTLRNLVGTAQLAGAIHKTFIRVNVNV